MKALRGIKDSPIQWLLYSGLSYLFIAPLVGLFFHKGPLINSGDQVGSIPWQLNVVLVVICFCLGAYASDRENKGRH